MVPSGYVQPCFSLQSFLMASEHKFSFQAEVLALKRQLQNFSFSLVYFSKACGKQHELVMVVAHTISFACDKQGGRYSLFSSKV